jgi:hypothetical protein
LEVVGCEGARFLDLEAEKGAGRPPCLFQYSSMISVEPLTNEGV